MRSYFSLNTRTDSIKNQTHDSELLVICDIIITSTPPLGHVVCYVLVKLQNGGDRRGAGWVFLIACCRSKIATTRTNFNVKNYHTSKAKGTKVTTKKLGWKYIVAEKVF